jgi:DNA-binding winged helix-turn-helix (wHTH) protein
VEPSTVEVSLLRGIDGACYSFGSFRLRADGILCVGAQVVALTPTEEGFLRVLVEAAGMRVAKDAIAERVWPRTAVSDSSLSRCVHTLRRKLEAATRAAAPIATCYGRGYRLTLPVTPVEPGGAERSSASLARFPHPRPAPAGTELPARAMGTD